MSYTNTPSPHGSIHVFIFPCLAHMLFLAVTPKTSVGSAIGSRSDRKPVKQVRSSFALYPPIFPSAIKAYSIVRIGLKWRTSTLKLLSVLRNGAQSTVYSSTAHQAQPGKAAEPEIQYIAVVGKVEKRKICPKEFFIYRKAVSLGIFTQVRSLSI